MIGKRYMLQLAYNGANYHGWQRQPSAISVQQALEERLSLLLNTEIELVGCGRTDTGVHAEDYYAHFEYERDFPPGFLRRFNKFLPEDIVVYQLFRLPEEVHARFSAHSRAYRYDISLKKDPFRPDTVTYYSYAAQLDQQLVLQTAALLMDYEEFLPFCKTKSDARTMRCSLSRAAWIFAEDSWAFHIQADRFLRGMVRLIVGACLQVGRGQVPLEEVKSALDEQRPMQGAWSAPPDGLFLSEVKYLGKSEWETLF